MSKISAEFSTMKRSIVLIVAVVVAGIGLAVGGQDSRSILTRPAPAFDHKIPYGPDPSQFGELRLPKGAGPFPVVLVVHGGCWMAEYGLGYMGHLASDLRDAGYATWNIEYRRVGNSGGSWPGTFQDVAAAADYLRTLAKKYPLDLDRVAALGHSAGGHLALWLGARHKLPEGSPLWSADPLKLHAIIPIAAITDLGRTGTACDDSVKMLMTGGAMSQSSPIELAPLGIPQLIVQGENDKIVPQAMARDYYRSALDRGDKVTLMVIENAGHFEPVDPATPAWRQAREAIKSLMK